MRTIVTLALFLTLAASGMAQITLIYSDYTSMLVPRTATGYTADILNSVSFDIGGHGAGQTWDLTGYTYTSQTSTGTFVDPATTPYASLFPVATHASGSAAGYAYILLDQTGFYILGLAGLVQGQQFVYTYDPPLPEMIFPGMLGSSWTYDGNPVAIPSDPGTQHIHSESQIDGEGTLTIPGGSFACLRIRTTDWISQKIEDNGQVVFEKVTKLVEYTLMTKNGVTATIFADTNSTETGMIMASRIGYSVSVGTSPVDDLAFSDDFALSAAYPNPLVSGAQTTVGWRLPVQTNVTVSVYDTRGREVALVFEGRLNAGAHTHTVGTSGLAPGMYMVRMYAGGRVLTSPLAVIR